jgi:cell division protein FtsB
MVLTDLLYVGMLVFVYGALVFVLFRFTRVMAAHEQNLSGLSENIALLDAETSKMVEFELQRQVEVDGLHQEITRLKTEIAHLEEQMSASALSSRRRIYMTYDRRNPRDAEFLIHVTNERIGTGGRQTAQTMSWASGRTYVIWSPNAELARNAAEGRFPSSAGYALDHVQRSPFNLGDRYGAAPATDPGR